MQRGDSTLLDNLFTVFSVWAPVFGILLAKLPLMNKRTVFYAAEITFAAIFVILASGIIQFFDPTGQSYQWTLSVAVYPAATCAFLALLYKKYEAKSFGLVFMLSLILTYLLTELHELPAFIRMYFGLWDNKAALPEYFVWYTPFNHLYSVFVGAVALKAAHIKLKYFALAFLLGLGLTAELYEGTSYGTFNVFTYATRLLWVPILGLLFYVGDRDGKATN